MAAVKIKIILCVCLAVCLTALGVSGFMLYNDYAQRQNDQNAFEQLDEVTRATNDEAVPDETTLPNTTESTTFDADTAAKVDEQEFVHLAGDTYRNHVHDFKSLREINSECIGWLSIYGTTIDYPVMHTPSNPEKYLNLNFYGDYSVSGVPFLDAGCKLNGDNMIIYGHDMNAGTMFAPLLNYTSKSFAQQHSVIQLETEQGVKKYSVYAVAKVKSNDMFYNLKNAPNKAFLEQKIKDISQRALYTIGSQPKYGQKLITLSTCTNDGQDNRLIVIAVQK